MEEQVSSSSSTPASSPSSHGDIVAALSSGMEKLTSESPTSTPPASGAPAPTTAASPAAPSGTDDPRTPPIAAAPDPDAELSTPVVGPIPPDRHKRILERTREKVAQETRAAFEKEHGPWLSLRSQFTPDEFQTLVPTLKDLASNPLRFMQSTARELGYQLVPIGQPAQPPAAPHGRGPVEEPQPDLQLEDGRLLYSADQQAKRDQWLLHQIKGEFTKELQPFREHQQQQEQQAFLGRIEASARAKFAEVAEYEGFEELRPKIAEIMANDKRYGLEGAYLRAHREHYLPTREAKIRQAVLDEVNHKARAAGSSLSPTRRVTAENGQTAPMSTADILRENAKAMGITL